MPTIYYTILFWIYWCIAAFFGILLARVIITHKDKGLQATAVMLIIPVILRLLLIK